MKCFLNIDKLELSFNLDEELNKKFLNGIEYEGELYSVCRASSTIINSFVYRIKLYNGDEFGTITNGNKYYNKNKLYLTLNNKTLYSSFMPIIYDIINLFNLKFESINSLDISLDFEKNIINHFYKLLKNEEYEFIILNKSRSMDEEIGELLHLSTGTRKNTKLNKGFYINNKEGGLTLNAYDKKKEIIDNNNKKEYINDIINTKKIYRLEIRTQHHILKDSYKNLGYSDEYLLDIIIRRDNSELLYLYQDLLKRLIRLKYKNIIYSLTDFFI